MASRPSRKTPKKPNRPAKTPPRTPPSEAELLARLPLAVGKRFESVRGLLKKQKGVTEELYYYGPKTGWAWRYLRGAQSLCSVTIHDWGLVGIVALDPAAQRAVAWDSLSPAGQKARKMAHGTPSLLWLDLPLEAAGAADFKTIVRAKLKTLPEA
jgi:hypothetical protein